MISSLLLSVCFLINVHLNKLLTGAGADPADMVLVTLTYSFFDGEERNPTDEEVKSLICKTQDFFSVELVKVLNDLQLSVKATDISWVYNEDGMNNFKLTFAADVTHGSGAPASENEVFQALKVADQDLHSYIVDYVSQINPPDGAGESVFFSVNEVNFESFQNVPIPMGMMPEGLSEVCGAPQASRGTNLGLSNQNNGAFAICGLFF